MSQSMSQTLARRLAPLIIRCYPPAWRARYAAEARQLMELRAPTWGDLGNMLFHVLYTRLHPDLLEEVDDGGGERADKMADLAPALRSSEITVFWAVVTTLLAWVQLGRLAHGGALLTLGDLVGPWPFLTTHRDSGVGAALAVQSAAVDLACVATLLGGVPLLVVAWRRSPAVRQYFVVPLLALIGAVAPPCIVRSMRGVVVIYSTVATPLTTIYYAWCVGLVVASALALTRIVVAGQVDESLLRSAFAPAVVATVALALVTTLTWGLAAQAEMPRLVDSAAIARQAARAAPWLLDALVMTGATSIAVLATMRGARCRITPPRQAE